MGNFRSCSCRWAPPPEAPSVSSCRSSSRLRLLGKIAGAPWSSCSACTRWGCSESTSWYSEKRVQVERKPRGVGGAFLVGPRVRVRCWTLRASASHILAGTFLGDRRHAGNRRAGTSAAGAISPSLGLGVPFLADLDCDQPVLLGILVRIRKHDHAIEVTSGVLLLRNRRADLHQPVHDHRPGPVALPLPTLQRTPIGSDWFGSGPIRSDRVAAAIQMRNPPSQSAIRNPNYPQCYRSPYVLLPDETPPVGGRPMRARHLPVRPLESGPLAQAHRHDRCSTRWSSNRIELTSNISSTLKTAQLASTPRRPASCSTWPARRSRP